MFDHIGNEKRTYSKRLFLVMMCLQVVFAVSNSNRVWPGAAWTPCPATSSGTVWWLPLQSQVPVSAFGLFLYQRMLVTERPALLQDSKSFYGIVCLQNVSIFLEAVILGWTDLYGWVFNVESSRLVALCLLTFKGFSKIYIISHLKCIFTLSRRNWKIISLEIRGLDILYFLDDSFRLAVMSANHPLLLLFSQVHYQSSLPSIPLKILPSIREHPLRWPLLALFYLSLAISYLHIYISHLCTRLH